MGEGRYSRDEIAAILKRAAEIEVEGEGEQRNGAQAAGLSLTDLESIAQDSGLDPASVRAAARELAGTGSVAAPETLSAPVSGVRLHHHRSLDGELDEAELERLVQLAGTRLHLPGRTTRKRNGWQWAARWGHRRLSVHAESRRGRTIIELDEDLRRLAASLYWSIVGGLGGVGFGLGFVFGMNVESSIAGALAMATIGTLASLAVGFGISHVMFRRFRLMRDVQLQRLVTELEREGRELLSAVSVDARPASEETEREPRRAPLHRDVQDSDDREEDERRRRGRRRGRSRN